MVAFCNSFFYSGGMNDYDMHVLMQFLTLFLISAQWPELLILCFFTIVIIILCNMYIIHVHLCKMFYKILTTCIINES